MHLLLLSALLGCAGSPSDTASTCTGFPDEATPVERTLGFSDDCGRWQLAVDQHAYINVRVDEADATCVGTIEGGVEMPYDPIYSNSANEAPKWTFDVVGVEEGEGSLDVSCDEGTSWQARFEVVESMGVRGG